MNIPRRNILKYSYISAVFASLAGFSKLVFAEWPTIAFDQTEYDKALADVTGGETMQEGNITIDAPEIASNGATVPITISTDLDDVKSIDVLVVNNPRPYIATFFINDLIESSVSLRVKMRETSNVVAVVKTGSGLYTAKTPVKVTAGGC
ncbi:MAG: thiosulfate oxidation carrier protein SoxY [Pseudomonadota bacterium]